ncbi:hypothetical protein DY000_02021999 [Brassica cretica]|uniref:START domain-containing protein n=1 Tax=Brassica cretica TaxID=69181 RepID=A0ABQ7EGJ2_BRACR|nr:hypothetical protein DY000_02021999 [Brassica cretica]
MPLDLESTLKTILESSKRISESQERTLESQQRTLESQQRTIFENQEWMISRSSTFCARAYEPNPTSYYEAYESSTSNGYQPDGDFGQENHWEFGERYQPWNTEYGYQASHPSQSYDEEETCSMLKLILEKSERMAERMEAWAHANNKHTHKIEEQEEESIHVHDNNPYEAQRKIMPLDLESTLKIILESSKRISESQERTLESQQRNIFENQEWVISRSSTFCARAYEPNPTSYHEAYESPQTGINLMETLVKKTIGSMVRDTNIGTQNMAIKHLILPNPMMKKKLAIC